MALTRTPSAENIQSQMGRQTAATATADENIFGDAPAVYAVHIDNASGAPAYVKLYDATAVTVGTTAPDLVFPVLASAQLVVSIVEGVTMSNAVSLAGVTAAGTGGTTDPSGGNVGVHIVVK